MAKENSRLNQLNNKPLREQVVEALRDAIVQGDFKPGQPLIESDIATQLGVSRAPVREALQILDTEGLVQAVAYHGTIVRKLTKTDIEELYSFRSMMEAFAIRRIFAQNNITSLVDALQQHYASMLAGAETGDLKKVNDIDRQFHDALIEFSNHQLLNSIWNAVSMRIRQVMALLNMRNTDLKQVAHNHLPIIEAIAARDEEVAVTLICEHVAASGELIAEGWNDSEGAD